MSSEPLPASLDGPTVARGSGEDEKRASCAETGEVTTPPRPIFLVRALTLGPATLIVSVIVIGVQILAIVLASGGHWLTGTVLAWGVIVLSAATFLTAIVAAVRGFGRRSALAAVALSLLGNPLVLIRLLDSLQGR